MEYVSGGQDRLDFRPHSWFREPEQIPPLCTVVNLQSSDGQPFADISHRKTSQEDLQRFKADQEDFEWLVMHSREIEEQFKGKYVAVVNKEVFVGDSFEEAEQKAKAKYPQRDPYVEFIPLKPRVMVL